MLSEAKDLSRPAQRCFAEFTLSEANGLSMTALNLSVEEELSSSFEPCLKPIIGSVREVLIRAPLRFAEAPTDGWSNVLMCIIGPYVPLPD